MRYLVAWCAGALLAGPAVADPQVDLATAFGDRPTVEHLSLSPDGRSVAYLTPRGDRGTALVTLALAKDAHPAVALVASGKPERLEWCNWVANDRLVCRLRWIGPQPDLLPFTRLVAVNADGSNFKLLNRQSSYSHELELGRGGIIDWLPEEDGAVLMSRETGATEAFGSRVGSSERGLGVERIDTRTLAARQIKAPLGTATSYITDGHGELRIMSERVLSRGELDSGSIRFSYRDRGGTEWHRLCAFNFVDKGGFLPLSVDRDSNTAYGLKKKDGRLAIYTMSLDGEAHETLVYARDDVDVDEVIRLGRRSRIVGVSYAAEFRKPYYTDPAIAQLMGALHKALPARTDVDVVDASTDETKLLVFSTSDVDAGVYYLFDRQAHRLETFLVARAPLEGVSLAIERPVSIPGSGGISIPAYLTLPPGKLAAKGLPAVVLPHGGPSARDEWGFNWLAQYFAAKGYAVLQPNFRGSTGYGDAWFKQNGFRSWPDAIADVLESGRWLVSQGIADPNQLAVVGWSYGGYAALQSVVADSSVFKAAVAIAAVTDLPALSEQYRNWSNYYLMRDFIGTGSHVREGSPAENAAKIKVPVLLFHGTEDVNVRIVQSQLMDRALTSAGVKHELVTFEGLDHQLDDSRVRAEMLRRSDAFLQAAFVH